VETLALGQDNSDSAGRGDGVRHQSFPASLVYGRAISIGHRHAQSPGAGCDGGSKPCRSTANYENIGIQHCSYGHLKRTNSEQSPEPAAGNTPNLPDGGPSFSSPVPGSKAGAD
jgi:hypothetical protein